MWFDITYVTKSWEALSIIIIITIKNNTFILSLEITNRKTD